MKVGIDARLLGTKIRGTARYLQNLIKYIPKYDSINKYFLFQYDDVPAEIEFYNYIRIKRSKLPRQIYEHYWLNFVLPQILEKEKINIFFTPYVFVPFRKLGWKNVIAIHDALTKTCKQYYSLHYRKYMDILVPQAIKRSDHIITVSNHAKNDIVKYYNVLEDKITVCYLWTDDKYKPIKITRDLKDYLLKKYNIPQEYILFVSVLEERKNLKAILKISDLLQLMGYEIKFVLVGRKGFGFSKYENEFTKRQEQIIIIHEVDDDDLVLIYNNAKVFLFPSLYEGFGLPPLEAMSCGIPVVAAKNSSIIEVVNDGGILVDTHDYERYAQSIIKLISDNNYYISLKDKAIRNAEKFSAENHINKLIEIFENLYHL